MAEIVGTGDYKYRIIEDWAKLPDGWSFKEVAAVGIDLTTTSMRSLAASTRSSSSTVTAISCAHGARANTRGRTASIWGRMIRSI